MPLSEDYAKDLLRKLHSEIEVILEQEKYWDLTFLRVFLDRCDEVLFDDPRAGLELAKLAPRLAASIPQRRPHEWRYVGESEKRLHRELSVRSHAVLGGAHRAGAGFEEADRAYRVSRQICDSGPVRPETRANLYKRLARLRTAQKRYSDASKLVDFAIEVYRDRDQEYYADALLMKGYVLGESGRHAEAIPFFGEALQLTKPMRRSSSLVKRTFRSAVHNLANAVSRGCGPDDVIAAHRFVKEAKKFYVKKPSSINKHKLNWVEGRVVSRLGSTRLAERRFRGAVEQFLKLGAPLEAAFSSLDLAIIYLRHGQWTELRTLAAETYDRFRALSHDAEALAALKLCMDGAAEHALSEAKIVHARDALERLVLQQRP